MSRAVSHPSPAIGAAIIIFFALLAAALLGALTGLSQPLFAAVGFGLIASVALLAAPLAGLWLATALTLFISGPVQYFLPRMGARLDWAAYLLAGSLFVPAFVSIALGRKASDKPITSTSVTVGLFVFIFVALMSTALNAGATFEIIAAIKSYVLFGGLWALLALYPFTGQAVRKWLGFLLAIGLIQWLPAIYQYIFVRGKRLVTGLGDTTEASDAVVGTFPGSLTAGGLSAVLAMFVAILIAGLLAAYREKLLDKKRTVLFLVLLAVPVLLAEVKAIFIYLPVALMLVYGAELKRRPVAFVALAIGCVLAVSALLLAYDRLHWSKRSGDFSTRVEKLFSYSFEDRPPSFQMRYGVMSRREAVSFWVEHGTANAVATLIGHGIGSSRTEGLTLGHAARPYYPAPIDGTGLSLLLWEVGLIGTGAVFAMLLAGYQAARRLASKLSDPGRRAVARTLQVSFLLFLLSIPYRNDIPYAAPMMFMVMTAFGLLGWLNRSREGNG